MITENDVRLMRRYLVARQYNQTDAMQVLREYLNQLGENLVYPGEHTDQELRVALARLTAAEAGLAMQYGCIILPDHDDCIFLNKFWMNPLTLYVRLVEPIPVLGELGQKYWTPDVNWEARASVANATETPDVHPKVAERENWLLSLFSKLRGE